MKLRLTIYYFFKKDVENFKNISNKSCTIIKIKLNNISKFIMHISVYLF